MAYKVTIGHLVCDEYGTSGSAKSKPGDQTGQESRLQDWYDGNWEYVFRPKTDKLANKLAQAMMTICTMPNLGGYNQTRRTSLAKYAKLHNWRLDEVTEECESDCSSSIAVCLNAANVPVSIDMYTGNEKAIIEATGKFKTLSTSKYLNKSDALKRGDILLKKGHTAMVINKNYIIKKELKLGSKGNDVKQVQIYLNRLGHNLDEDGVYGDHTEAAVIVFQNDKKIKADGIVGMVTAYCMGFAWER